MIETNLAAPDGPVGSSPVCERPLQVQVIRRPVRLALGLPEIDGYGAAIFNLPLDGRSVFGFRLSERASIKNFRKRRTAGKYAQVLRCPDIEGGVAFDLKD
ncbi:MAG: hypothetical protein V5A48_11055, partial [Salinivenus sp.]